MAEDKDSANERHGRHEDHFKDLYQILGKKVSWTVFWSIFALAVLLTVGGFGKAYSDIGTLQTENSQRMAEQARQSALLDGMKQQLDRIERAVDRQNGGRQ